MKYDLEQLLLDRNIQFRKSNNPNELKIQCISGLHIDKDPSLEFNLSKNVFHCWSCGFKGTLNTFLKALGIQSKVPIETKTEFKIEKIKEKLKEIRSAEGIRMPSNVVRHLAGFRNIHGSIMEEFGAFLTPELGLEDYLCIPVYQHRKLRFIEGRLMNESTSKPKYYRRPQGVNTNDILFPLDKLPNVKKVILVEGIFDMLYLHQNGYKNALSIFGTQNFSQKKVHLLDSIGVLSVDIVLDGDQAGRQATDRIKNLLEQKNIKCNAIYIPDKKDVDDLPLYELKYFLGEPIT